MSSVMSNARLNIIDTCKIALGYPVISLFVTDEQIIKLMDFAVRKCSSKASPTYTASVLAGGVVDVSAYDIDTIKNIYSNISGDSNLGYDLSSDLFNYQKYTDMTRGDWNNTMYDRMAYQYAKSEVQKEALFDWYMDKGLLYLDNYSGVITIEYIKKSIALEDLDSFWTSWVESYTLAMVKIAEGRIRGKYKPSSGVFEIDSDELVNEGNTEKQELEEKLNEYIGYWNIMR